MSSLLPFRHRSAHRPLIAMPLAVMLMLAGLVFPVLSAPAAAQSTSLPENVLQASVRIMTMIEVVPDNSAEDPFLCTLPSGELLEYSVGSGTIISEDGYVLTNHHVVGDQRMPREIERYCSGQIRGGGEVDFVKIVWSPDERGIPEHAYRVEIIADSSLVEDMAVLQITTFADGSRVNTRRNPFPYVTFGNSDDLREPETLTVIGYPANAGSNRRVSEGIFSGWGDNGYGVNWIYTDAVISGGNSGGTAVNSRGHFIGIPTQATASDCRVGDTNNDGVIDERDGCIGIGGNYGIIIPSNIARAFAEEATGLTFEVEESATPRSTPAVDPTNESVDPATPLVENIELLGSDDDGNEIADFTDIRRLEACFDSTIPGGSVLEVTWFLNGESYFFSELDWRDSYNPTGCVSIFLNEQATMPFLEPGVYYAQILVEGEMFMSPEVEVFRSTGDTNVESVSVSGRTTDRTSLDAVDGVLEGDISTLTITIDFEGMEPGSAWQVDLYLNGSLVTSSEAGVWESEDDAGTESVRLRTLDREPFAPGIYDIVITVDGTEASSTELEITG